MLLELPKAREPVFVALCNSRSWVSKNIFILMDCSALTHCCKFSHQNMKSVYSKYRCAHQLIDTTAYLDQICLQIQKLLEKAQKGLERCHLKYFL